MEDIKKTNPRKPPCPVCGEPVETLDRCPCQAPAELGDDPLAPDLTPF